MADLSYTVDVNTTRGINNLQKLQDKVSRTSKVFGGLQTAVAGFITAAAVRGAINFGATITDLSKATGVATSNILGMSAAIVHNGGTSEGAQKSLAKFVENIGAAADGATLTQDAFNKVGVSLKDLADLSEQDLFDKTLKGLAGINDISRRTYLATLLLGKGVKGVDVAGWAADYAGATAANQKYASSLETAATLNDKLSDATVRFQVALLKALEPLLKFINNLSAEQIDRFVEALVKIGAAVVSITALGAAFRLVGSAMLVMTAIGGTLATWWTATKLGLLGGAADIGVAFSKMGKTLNIAGSYIKGAWKGITPMWVNAAKEGKTLSLLAEKMAARFGFATASAKLFGAGLVKMIPFVGTFASVTLLAQQAVDAVNDAFGRGNKGANGFARGVENLGFAVGKLLNIPTDGLAGLMNLFGAGIKDPMGLGTPLLKLVDHAEKARLAIEGVNAAALPPTGAGGGRGGQGGPTAAELNKEGNANRIVVETWTAKGDAIRQASADFRKYTGELKTTLDQEAAFMNMNQDEVEVIRLQTAIYAKAADEIQALTDKKAQLTGEELKLGPIYDEQISKIQKLADTSAVQAAESLKDLQAARYAEENRRIAIEKTTQAITDQFNRQQQLSGLIKDADSAIRDAQQAGATATKTPIEQQYDAIRESARKAAEQSAAAFASGFDQFNMTNDQAIELVNGLDAIASKYKTLSDVQIANLDASKTWSAGWNNAFAAYVDDATNASKAAGEAFSSVTSNMNSAIDKFVDSGKMSFGDLASSIIKDLIKIELKAMASKVLAPMISGAGSFFAGLLGFANGGTPPLNKPSIVGERGPELFVPRSAGTIIPNDKLGGGGGQQVVNNTYNTYNVNAVDAKSVAQLFAENRRTLLGTMQMAQKESSYR